MFNSITYQYYRKDEKFIHMRVSLMDTKIQDKSHFQGYIRQRSEKITTIKEDLRINFLN